METTHFPIALLAGVISFLSPCVLPLIPGYISMISGLSFEELTQVSDKKALRAYIAAAAGLFVLGFSTVFTLMGAFATGIGGPLSAYLPIAKKIAGVVIILFGLHTMGVMPIQMLYRQKQMSLDRFRPGWVGAFFVGAAFAVGWVPCVGPILGGILALATTEETLWQGMALLFTYSMGLGIPFILTGLSINRFTQFLKRYRRFIIWGERVAGLLLILIGILLFVDKLGTILPTETFFKKFAL